MKFWIYTRFSGRVDDNLDVYFSFTKHMPRTVCTSSFIALDVN